MMEIDVYLSDLGAYGPALSCQTLGGSSLQYVLSEVEQILYCFIKEINYDRELYISAFIYVQLQIFPEMQSPL